LITRIVWCSHTQECNFWMQRVISTRRVLFLHAVWICQAQIWLKHVRMWSIHAKCNFHLQSVISTHKSVVVIRMRVNMTLTSVIYTRKVRFLQHAQCRFHTQCDFVMISTRTRLIFTRRVWLYTQSVVSTHTRVISTRILKTKHTYHLFLGPFSFLGLLNWSWSWNKKT
jgi:hypothetical protein